MCIKPPDPNPTSSGSGSINRYYIAALSFNEIMSKSTAASKAQGGNTKTLSITSGQQVDPGQYLTSGGLTLYFNVPTIVDFFIDANGNGEYDEGEEIVYNQIFTLTKEADNFNYSLLTGWNAVNFPFVKNAESLYTASEIRAIAVGQGIDISSIKTWEGQWMEYTIVEGITYGEDFAIVPNKGYFIQAENRGVISIQGITSTTATPVQLLNGWSLIGVAPGYDDNGNKSYNNLEFTDGIGAFEFIDIVNRIDSTINMSNVTRLQSGVYRGVNYAADKAGLKRQFGLDFNLNELESYFVKSEKKTVINP